MSHEPVTILLPPSVAKCIAQNAPLSERLAWAAGRGDAPPAVRVSCLYVLAHDPQSVVREAALCSMSLLPDLELLEALSSTDIHPRVLEAFARLFRKRQDILDIIALHEAAESSTLEMLASWGNDIAKSRLSPSAASPVEEPVPEDSEPVDEQSEEFLSKYQLTQQMSISEKIKTALTGDKEWRGLLIKDSNKLVSSAVVKNPRITEPEVLTICKGVVQNDDIIRIICGNKEWIKNYQIRKALITNAKTPLAKALRYMNTLTEKDVAGLAKSKNVSSVISTQARRIMAQKEQKR